MLYDCVNPDLAWCPVRPTVGCKCHDYLLVQNVLTRMQKCGGKNIDFSTTLIFTLNMMRLCERSTAIIRS